MEPVLPTQSDGGDEDYRQLLDQITDLLTQSRRIAVIGMTNPIEAVDRLIPRLSMRARREFSFTTGLSPAIRRPFQAHFLADADLTRKRTLDSQNIVCLAAS
jgi:hypothetical protein